MKRYQLLEYIRVVRQILLVFFFFYRVPILLNLKREFKVTKNILRYYIQFYVYLLYFYFSHIFQLLCVRRHPCLMQVYFILLKLYNTRAQYLSNNYNNYYNILTQNKKKKGKNELLRTYTNEYIIIYCFIFFFRLLYIYIYIYPRYYSFIITIVVSNSFSLYCRFHDNIIITWAHIRRGRAIKTSQPRNDNNYNNIRNRYRIIRVIIIINY